MVEQNRQAWEAQAYESWTRVYGTPADLAAELVANPAHRLRRFTPYLGDLKGKKLANPLGSNGRLATAFSLVGADVTVFDISAGNQRYALELAHEAGVALTYILGNFGALDLTAYEGSFDAVVIDHGVLHYFVELTAFVSRIRSLLKTGGQLIINEFHPLMKKAVSIVDQKIAFTGDYFAQGIETVPVAYAPFAANPEALPSCLVRRWTLGEIVTAFAQGGFCIEVLLELPHTASPSLPGTFVMVARRA